MKPSLRHVQRAADRVGGYRSYLLPALVLVLGLVLGRHGPARGADWLPTSAATSLLLVTGAGALLTLGLLWLLWRQQAWRSDRDRLVRQLATESTLRVNAQLAVLTTHAALSKLMAKQAVIKTGERRRIARDIHDDLGQNLLALKIELSLLQMSTRDRHPALHQQLGLVAQHVEMTIRSMRSVVLDLQPITLEAGLRIALQRQLHEFGRINNISCEFHDTPAVYGNGIALDTLLFRSTQEALSNIVRHAQASVVSLTLQRGSNSVSMTVCDNGVGLPVGQASRGCGLNGMQQRVQAAGGCFSIVSQPGTGTVLSLSIPLADAADAADAAPAEHSYVTQ